MIKATVEGRAVRDFELKNSEEGRVWGIFTIASNRNYTPKGADTPETDYINVYVAGKFAEKCAEHIKKGIPVVAIGDFEINRSAGKDGKEYTNIDLRNADIRWFSR